MRVEAGAPRRRVPFSTAGVESAVPRRCPFQFGKKPTASRKGKRSAGCTPFHANNQWLSSLHICASVRKRRDDCGPLYGFFGSHT